jgi:hypothetical protein
MQPECEKRRGQQIQEADVPIAKTVLFFTLTNIQANSNVFVRTQKRQNRECTYNVTLRHVRVTSFAVEKQKSLHIMSVSVVLVIQHPMSMRRIILPSVACPAVPHYLIKGAIFGGNKIY